MSEQPDETKIVQIERPPEVQVSSNGKGEPAQPGPKLSYAGIFTVFLKAGFAFGGGLGILAVLEDELVTRRKIISHEDFLALYGLGRIVPSGTMTALAVAYGYRFGGWVGTAIALVALALPAFIITIVLTILYGLFKSTNFVDWLQVSVLPAALGFIVLAAFRLGSTIYRVPRELILAVLAFVAVQFFPISPSIVLVAGGLVGVLLFHFEKEEEAE